MTAAICSAIAAAFSAFTTFLVLIVQHRNLLESTRPDLIIAEWGRDPYRPSPDVLTFKTIKNVGKGNAFDVTVHAGALERYGMGTLHTAVISPNFESALVGNVELQWDLANPARLRDMPVDVTLDCWDTCGNQYSTTYSLVVFHGTPEMGDHGSIVAPQVRQVARRTRCVPAWQRSLALKKDALLAWWKEKVIVPAKPVSPEQTPSPVAASTAERPAEPTPAGDPTQSA